jgi:hypothetical protein
MYLTCSWYLCLEVRPDCPTYERLHVEHVSLQIPLCAYSFCVTHTFGSRRSYMVFVLRNTMPIFVCLNRLVIVRMSGLFGFYFVCKFILRTNVYEKLLALAVYRNMFHSFCSCAGKRGRECVRLSRYLYAVAFCSMGWSERKSIVVYVIECFRYVSISTALQGTVYM